MCLEFSSTGVCRVKNFFSDFSYAMKQIKRVKELTRRKQDMLFRL